ncbi:MAG: ABC transporter permease subunit, partial [Mariprofundaceae bacterium]|nr:ABC transporter permease subunit [Mariprofundaceae bacterium]
VYGLSGLVLFVHLLHWGISLLAGQVILAVIIMPLFVENIITAIERIDPHITRAARSLGLSDAMIVRRVWLPHAWSGVLTGTLLGMARALSETAPILFTATVFSGITFPESVFEPVTSLQTHIFYLAQEGGSDHARQAAWSSALILIGLISTLSIAAGALRRMEAGHEHRT